MVTTTAAFPFATAYTDPSEVGCSPPLHPFGWVAFDEVRTGAAWSTSARAEPALPRYGRTVAWTLPSGRWKKQAGDDLSAETLTLPTCCPFAEAIFPLLKYGHDPVRAGFGFGGGVGDEGRTVLVLG